MAGLWGDAIGASLALTRFPKWLLETGLLKNIKGNGLDEVYLQFYSILMATSIFTLSNKECHQRRDDA